MPPIGQPSRFHILDSLRGDTILRRVTTPLPRIKPLNAEIAMKKYTPAPLDTEGVSLPPSLLALTEQLAENTHEVWSALRLKQGWTYGPERNDAEMKHPCLVPYDQLSEEEKDVDRATVSGVLKAMLKLGYTIKKGE